MKKLLKGVAVTLMLVASGILAAGGGWGSVAAQQGTIRPQFIEEDPTTVPYNPCPKGTVTATAKIDGWNFGTRQWSWVKHLYVHIPYIEGHAKYTGVADPWIIDVPAPSTIAKVRWDFAVMDDMRCTVVMPGPGVLLLSPIRASGDVSTYEREEDPTGGDCTLLVGCDDGGGSGGGGTGGSGGGDGGDAQLYLICLYNVTTDVNTGQTISKVLVGCTIGY